MIRRSPVKSKPPRPYTPDPGQLVLPSALVMARSAMTKALADSDLTLAEWTVVSKALAVERAAVNEILRGLS